MLIRKCPRCGNTFEGVKQQLLCPHCRAAAKSAPTFIEHVCKTCGAVFIGGPRATYCPECRQERKKQQKKISNSKQRAGLTRKLGSTDICERCGQPYTVMNGLQRYCPACAPVAIAEKVKPSKVARAAVHSQEKSKIRREWKQNGTICVICGKPFTSTGSNTCSETCAAERRRQWQRSADAKRRHKE